MPDQVRPRADVGVVISRFQTPRLTAGHLGLLRRVQADHPMMLVQHEDGRFETVAEGAYPPERNILQDVFVDGAVVRHQSMQEIRALAAK